MFLYNSIEMEFPFLMLALSAIAAAQSLSPSINITNTIILSDQGHFNVLINGSLNGYYDDTTYNQVLNCKNGQLIIINNTNGNTLEFSYRGLAPLDQNNTNIFVQPNSDPKPFLDNFTSSTFELSFNCPQNISNANFFNKVNIEIQDKFNISFMLDCDPGKRHKTFEYGYLAISALNALILIGVAMNSYIWSIKYKGKRITIVLRWRHILGACIIGIVLALALYLFAFKSFGSAFLTLRYVGIVISVFFVFICFNEVFYLTRVLKKPCYKAIRYCDFMSLICTIIVMIISLLFENWILYDALACCICVACIKLFHFQSLKQAFLSKFIVVCTVTIMAIVFHFIFPDRSYNDYATELSSPLFLMVPDLDNSLYKKCSWLLTADVIIPGVVLAYLRIFDENRDSKMGGVYTVWGNITVIFATILWVGLQALYPFSIPFSLVVYLCLMLVIFLLSWKRNQWKDLYEGSFQKDRSVVDETKLTEKNKSFSSLIGDDILEKLRRERDSADDSSSSAHNNSGLHDK